MRKSKLGFPRTRMLFEREDCINWYCFSCSIAFGVSGNIVKFSIVQYHLNSSL